MILRRSPSTSLPARCARAQGGAVMLEFVLAFPLFLVLAFACLQFAHLWVAKMVVHYAAYSAARSALVCTTGQYDGDTSPPSRAARAVCALLQQPWPAGPADRTSTTVTDLGDWNVKATTTHTFSLVVPLVGQIIAWGMNPWDDSVGWAAPGKTPSNTDRLGPKVGFPTLALTESVILPKPYVRMEEAIFAP